jgi:transposase
MDAQSVKNTGCAKMKGYDGGKKVSGVKRRLAVDSQGLPLAAAVTTADVTDRKGALEVFTRSKAALPSIQSVMADGGYPGQPFAEAVENLIGAAAQAVKRSELSVFKVIPKRWGVERSFAGLEKCRRLWKNCGRNLNTSLQFVHLAFLALILRRL